LKQLAKELPMNNFRNKQAERIKMKVHFGHHHSVRKRIFYKYLLMYEQIKKNDNM